MTYKEILVKYSKKPYADLVRLGKGEISKTLPKIQQLLNGDKDSAISYLFCLIGSCMGIDNSLSSYEVQYINDVLGTNKSFEDCKALAIDATEEDIIESIDTITDALDHDTKIALGVFCVCIFAVDKRVADNEVAYLEKLIAD